MNQQENSSNLNNFFENPSFSIEHLSDFELGFNRIFEELVNTKEFNDETKELLFLELQSILDKQILLQFKQSSEINCFNESTNLQKNYWDYFNLIHEELGKYKQISINQEGKITFLKLKIDEFKKIINIKEEKINLLLNEINIIKNDFLSKNFAEFPNLIDETEMLGTLFDKDNEIEKLNKIIIILKKYNVDKDIEIKNLNTILIEKEEDIKKSTNEFDLQRLNFSNEIDKLNNQIVELQEFASLNHDKISTLNDTINSKDEKIIELEMLINDHCSTIERLNKLVEDNELKYKGMEEEFLKIIDDDNNKIESLEDKFSIEKKEYCSTIERLNKLVEDNELKYKGMEEEFLKIIDDDNNKIESLNENLSIEQSKINKYENEILSLNNNIKNKNIEHAILKEHLNDSKRINDSLSLENNELNNMVLEKCGEINHLKESNNSLNDQINSLNLMTNEKDSTIDSLRKEISILNKIIDEKNETIDFLKVRCNNV